MVLGKEISKSEELLDVLDSLYPATLKFTKEVKGNNLYFLNIILNELETEAAFQMCSY